MQTKKDELYQTLLSNAEKEFFEKGFAAGSLRGIAKASGTTIGNLYHYFASKEALFEALVKDEYESFKSFIGHHDQVQDSQAVIDEPDTGAWREILKKYIKGLSPIFTKRFYLLINASQGTQFEGARKELLRVMEEHFLEHFKESKAICYPELGRIISEQLLSSIIAIIRDYEEEEKRTELLVEIILFTIIGVMGFMQSYTKTRGEADD